MRVPLLLAALLIAPAAHAACSVADVTVTLHRAKWVDLCGSSPCPTLKGSATLTHRCADPMGVQVRIVGLAKDGSPVAVSEKWPFSIRNVPAGPQPFSIDGWLDHDDEIVKFTLEPVQVHHWSD